jgi:hypothetical protein
MGLDRTLDGVVVWNLALSEGLPVTNVNTSYATRALVFDLKAEYDDAYPLEEEAPVTEEMVGEIVAKVNRSGVSRFRIGRKVIRNYLANPGKFTPFIDQIAIERARDFDPVALAGLSLDEFDYLIALFSLMEEPWEFFGGENEDARFKANRNPQKSPRRMAYEALPDKVRAALRDRTMKYGANSVERWKGFI